VEGHALVGHAAYWPVRDRRADAALAVRPEWRGAGLAAELLARLAEHADAAGVPTLLLDVGAADAELLDAVHAGYATAEQRRGDHIRVRLTTRDWPRVSSGRPRPRPSVLVIGGGVAALEAVMALRNAAGDAVRISIVASNEDFAYRPMAVAEPFSLGHVQYHRLRAIADDFGATVTRDAAIAVDVDAHRVRAASGATYAYDRLIVATGAREEPAFDHAITFGQDGAREAFEGLLADVEAGYLSRVAFVAPGEAAWTLPLYELALMTAREVAAQGIDAAFTIVTGEERPLAVFGPGPSEAVAQLLADTRVAFVGSARPRVERFEIIPRPGIPAIPVDRTVALPLLRGPALPGLPADANGFIPVDGHGRVTGAPDVYAAGDATTFPIKQGGLATQQADAVAEAVAADVGLLADPVPFRPVLRGMLFTGGPSRFLRAGIAGGTGDGESSVHALWWPPTKIAGRHLAPYLAARDERARTPAPPAGFADVELALA